MLLRALESHSTALFVTCNSAAEDCMDDRLQSRFHLCLELPELTAATRAKIWQKCLEFHKDIKFYNNFSTLGQWTLNGREISNAVTAAKNLTKGGTMETTHLERVVPANKRIVEHIDVIWDFPIKPTKKKGKKVTVDEDIQPPPDVVEISEEPPEKSDDVWADWGAFKPKKSKKTKPVADVEGQSNDEVLVVEEPSTIKEDLGWGSFGVKKDKKKGKQNADTTSSPAPTPPTVQEHDLKPEIAPPIALDEDDFSWGDWGRIPKKKSKKIAPEGAIPPPPPMDDTVCDEPWGTFGAKKEQKAQEVTTTEPTASVPNKTCASRDPIPTPSEDVPAEVDAWDFWATSKKSQKKKGKKHISDEEPPVPDVCPEEEPPAVKEPEVLDSAPDDEPLVIKSNPADDAAVPVAQDETLTNVKGKCRTCAGYVSVAKGQYCQYCGTLEGHRHKVCKNCASQNGYRTHGEVGARCKFCKRFVRE